MVVPEVADSKRFVGSSLLDTSLGMVAAVVAAAAVVVVVVVAVVVAVDAVVAAAAVEELTEPGRPEIDARMSRHRVESANCL